MKAENRIDLNIDNKGKGRRFESRFLQAGLVKYSFGVCLLSKEVIDRFAYKFVGCPVIIDHKDITDENAKDERVGVISKVWFNEFDGWFWCEGVVFDDEAISLIKDKGYNVSCQYNIDDYTENTANSLHNGNPYDITILDGSPEHLAIVKNPRYEEALIAVNKGEDMKAENTEFRTGYDSEGDAYVYPIDGADKKKSDKKTDKKEDKKPDYQDVIDKYDKKYDVDKNDKGESWYDRASDSELKTDIKDYENFLKSSKDEKQRTEKLLKDDNYSKWHNEFKRQIADLDREIGEYEDRIKYAKAHLEKKQATKSEDKKEDSKTTDSKIIEGGFKESTDKHGRTKFSKGNKWADVTSNGGRSDSWIASYGLTHPSGVSWEREKGVTEEQLLNSKSFKTEKGARKWALENLKRITSDDTPKEGKQLKLFNALEEQLERFVYLVAKNFDESKHKRDEDGKFTDSGNFSGKTVDEQEAELVKELKRLKKNGKAGIDGEKIEDMYKRLTGKEWQSQGAKKEDKKQVKKSQKIDGVKFDKVGKLIPSILKDMEKAYKESK